ncbi:fungal-specific transcription factor domain protein [Favolaschia claudopus]|uniref:Fungal-specific transcription factor domain protein n=1 Tax=Favolaschia claudopus TaxID=2862362 RepID=A0AAW0DGS7_9AGAR
MSSHLYVSSTPPEVSSAKGLHLITQNTPNGQATQIILEELAAVYGTSFTTSLIDISTNEQKKEWFLRLNPNGRIPVVVDNTRSPPFPIFETSAQLLYLTDHFDKEKKFGPGFENPLERSEVEQWLFFWHGGGAPYQGQVNFFSKNAPDNEFAINRFKKETLRVFGVIELQLSGIYTASGQPRDYLVGEGKGKYSIADIKSWSWIKYYPMRFSEEEVNKKEFPHLLAWIDRIAARPAVKLGTGEKYVPKK